MHRDPSLARVVTAPSPAVRTQVTGGAGFVGSHLTDKLMMDGHEVTVVDNFFTGRKRNVEHWIGHENFELINHDVVEPLYIEGVGFNVAAVASPDLAASQQSFTKFSSAHASSSCYFQSVTIVVYSLSGDFPQGLTDEEETRAWDRGAPALSGDPEGDKKQRRHGPGPRPRCSVFSVDVTDVVLPPTVDQIYHLASPASPPNYMYNPIKTLKTNTIGTLNMLGLAKRVGARLLLASTSEVYGASAEAHRVPEWHRVAHCVTCPSSIGADAVGAASLSPSQSADGTRPGP
ncbi:hypothetical protein J1605_005651 [Eschrichtius robustus]|uniref:UDP-glucuronate decarboxylase n=1 Tax=Eschrichtius robustus TaxID=9764 RepID=A0AB34H4Y3_ESCRO|nr:hypothetical protein J1605_005651 [Eschrichtius robustus]